MSDGIEIDGMEEFETMLQEMTVSEEDEKKAMRKAIKPVKDALERDSPHGATGKLSKIKTTVKKEDLATVGILRAGAWWDRYQEFGTSKQKKNVGYFARLVDGNKDKTMKILADELLNKAK